MGETRTEAKTVASMWRRAGIARPGATEAHLRNAEDRLAMRLPSGFRDLLLLADGMAPGDMDEEMVRFWPVAEWRPVQESMVAEHHDDYAGYVLFADFLLWSHGYAVRAGGPGADGSIVMVGGSELIRIAEDVDAFLAGYLTEPSAMLFGGAPGQARGSKARSQMS